MVGGVATAGDGRPDHSNIFYATKILSEDFKLAIATRMLIGVPFYDYLISKVFLTTTINEGIKANLHGENSSVGL